MTHEYKGFEIIEEGKDTLRVYTTTAETLAAWRKVSPRAITLTTNKAHCGDFGCSLDDIKEQINAIMAM